MAADHDWGEQAMARFIQRSGRQDEKYRSGRSRGGRCSICESRNTHQANRCADGAGLKASSPELLTNASAEAHIQSHPLGFSL